MTKDYHEADYQRVVTEVVKTRFLPGTSVEIIHEPERKAPPQHVLFDFDGTLSLIREGWPSIMVPMMVEILQATGTDESAERLHDCAFEFVMQLNGKQTIYQMIRLAEEVEGRGGTPEDPFVYKQMYLDRLMEHIGNRREALQSGAATPEEMVVPHSLEILTALKERGVALYVASGTDQCYVDEEARLLGLDGYFGEHIYGAQKDYKRFSKQAVIENILSKNRVEGSLLLGFGDGYVEIQNIKSVGGTAVAVASDEAGRSGKPDQWKRDRLMGVGADIVIPDFQDYKALLNYIWNE
ncbi:MAG: HAD family hydrolase [Candidatus Brocadiae bacterium]|nr:HAD family hydrolase [Candidatus Brocadiia bacterium]